MNIMHSIKKNRKQTISSGYSDIRPRKCYSTPTQTPNSFNGIEKIKQYTTGDCINLLLYNIRYITAN